MIFKFFQIMKKYLALWIFSFCSLFGISISESNIEVNNDSFLKTSNISLVPISYDTSIIYNDEMIYNEERIVSVGVDGYAIKETGEVLIKPVNEVIEVGRGPLSIVNGSTTGYGADCYGCSGTVACSTLEGKSHNLINDGIYYNDSKYGKVRIIAADNSLFKCGTIMEVDNGILDPFMAIVMDTGGAMRQAWRNDNKVLIDIAFSYESSNGIYNATNKSGDVEFKIYRNGW